VTIMKFVIDLYSFDHNYPYLFNNRKIMIMTQGQG